jgi:hypothetical protein
MKYYIYISDAKIDMLLQQISHDAKRKIATEFKIDLKILSASRKAETETDDSQITRLEAVCNFIREYGNVGSVDEPDEYIEDTLPMSWGIVGHDPCYAYFSGITDKTIIGLGGSARHVLGHSSSEAESLYLTLMSHAYSLHDALKKGVGDDNEVPIYEGDLTKTPPLIGVYFAAEGMMRQPVQRLEFIAKRLTESRVDKKCARYLEMTEGKNLILATPLYVALAE